jgi:hypothetical protein
LFSMIFFPRLYQLSDLWLADESCPELPTER